MPKKCNFHESCATKKCPNKSKCQNWAKKNGYCLKHTPVGGSGGITTHYEGPKILIPHAGECGTDWLGMKIDTC